MKHEVSLFLECCDWDLFYCKLLYDIYNPSGDDKLIQSAEIYVYESMIKIRVPVSESYNSMKIVKRNKKLGSKFTFAQALIKKYKKEIFWKHECNMKRDDRTSTPLFETVGQLKAPGCNESQKSIAHKNTVPQKKPYQDLEESKESKSEMDEEDFID